MNEQIEKAIEEVIVAAIKVEKEKNNLWEGGSAFAPDVESAEKELFFAKSHLKFLINREIKGQ